MRLLIPIISILVLLPSCKKGEVPSSDSSSEDTSKRIEVIFNSGLSFSVDEFSGRAPIEGNLLPVDSKVGIFGVKAVSTNWNDYTITSECQENLENAEYTAYDHGRLFQNYIAEYPKKSSGFNALVFYGYHPYVPNVMDYYDFMRDSYYVPVKLNKSDMSTTDDYLYTGRRNQITPSNNETIVNLPFKHALGRIRFIFSRTDVDVTVDGVAVSAKSSTEGKMFIDTGECIPNSTSTQQYRYVINRNLNSSEEITADFMMFPGVHINQIQCIINGVPYKVYDSSSQKLNLVAGKVINFRVNFSPQEANISSSIEGWEEQGSQDIDIDESTGDVVVKSEP